MRGLSSAVMEPVLGRSRVLEQDGEGGRVLDHCSCTNRGARSAIRSIRLKRLHTLPRWIDLGAAGEDLGRRQLVDWIELSREARLEIVADAAET